MKLQELLPSLELPIDIQSGQACETHSRKSKMGAVAKVRLSMVKSERLSRSCSVVPPPFDVARRHLERCQG